MSFNVCLAGWLAGRHTPSSEFPTFSFKSFVLHLGKWIDIHENPCSNMNQLVLKVLFGSFDVISLKTFNSCSFI